MKILITGANGFIGSHLKDRLKKSKQYEIITWDREQGDLKQPQNFPEVDVVIHLAAYNSTKEFYTKGLKSSKITS